MGWLFLYGFFLLSSGRLLDNWNGALLMFGIHLSCKMFFFITDINSESTFYDYCWCGASYRFHMPKIKQSVHCNHFGCVLHFNTYNKTSYYCGNVIAINCQRGLSKILNSITTHWCIRNANSHLLTKWPVFAVAMQRKWKKIQLIRHRIMSTLDFI